MVLILCVSLERICGAKWNPNLIHLINSSLHLQAVSCLYGYCEKKSFVFAYNIDGSFCQRISQHYFVVQRFQFC